MLLERYLAEALTAQFGHLVEQGLDGDSLRLSVWRGELVFRDVVLKRTALRDATATAAAVDGGDGSGPSSSDEEDEGDDDDDDDDDFPFELAHGRIGHLRVRIPWPRIRDVLLRRKRPQQQQQQQQAGNNDDTGNGNSSSKKDDKEEEKLAVEISDVHILVTPRRRRRRPRRQPPDGNSNDDDPDNGSSTVFISSREEEEEGTADGARQDGATANREREVQTALDAELVRRVARSSASAAPSTEQQSSKNNQQGWLSGVFRDQLRALWSDLVVTVRNVHVRYEDPGTSMGFVWYSSDNNTSSEHSGNTIGDSDHHRRPVRYRPPFAIGVTLKQFSIQSITAPTSTSVRKGARQGQPLMSGSSSVNETATATKVEESQQQQQQQQQQTNDNKGDEEVDPAARASIDHDDDDESEDPTAASAIRAGYRIRRKVAATRDFAAYWDSDCRLFAEQAGEDGSSSSFSSEAHAYYQSVFAGWESSSRPRNGGNHFYVLDPFSPSVEFTSVEEPSTTGDCSAQRHSRNPSELSPPGAGSSQPQQQRQPTVGGGTLPDTENDINARGAAVPPSLLSPPPSRVGISLPPCRLAVSRHLLQDLGYLRQSIVARQQATLLPEAALRRLTRLRPRTSPLQNPRGWWKYSGEAVLVLQSISNNNSNGTTGGQSSFFLSRRRPPKRRIRGWLALARAMGRRKRYVDLYRTFLGSENAAVRLSAHLDLLELEKVLQIDEVVAFRIASSFTLRDTTAGEGTPTNQRGMTASPTTGGTGGGSSSRRWQWLSAGQSSGASDKDVEDSFGLNEAILSVEHRASMFAEMSRALIREKINTEIQQEEEKRKSSQFALPPHFEVNRVVWTTSLVCPELSLRVNDRPTTRHSHETVAKLSCAVLTERQLYLDGSWELANRFGSLTVRDCTWSDDVNRQDDIVIFPNLLGPKGGKALPEDETLLLNGVAHHQSVHISVRRSLSREWGTTTTTTVRVLPLEIVYSTAPVEALSRILSIANLELADDYHRISSKLHEWRARQKTRLFEALAHKQKKILVDIDVGAPVLLLPEDSRRDSPLLILDFGRLQFRNDERRGLESTKFDDQWRLDLTDVQVQCSTSFKYRGIVSMQGETRFRQDGSGTLQQLIEPFCLDFAISTRIESDDKAVETFQILASLPRLVFNVTTSAKRLLIRLGNQWEKRKKVLEQFVSSQVQRDAAVGIMGKRRLSSARQPFTPSTRTPASGRVAVFQFAAPLLKFRFENDVDGRDCGRSDLGISRAATPLLDLSMRGIEGRLLSERSTSGDSRLSWNAKLRALDAIDLYQGAGDNYAFLLSSISPELLMGRNPVDLLSFDKLATSTDLVTFSFESSQKTPSETASPGFPSTCIGPTDKLSIKFHELYVEWNPETMAALQLAMNLPIGQNESGDGDTENFRDFFDVEEDEFFDAVSTVSDGGVSSELNLSSLLDDQPQFLLPQGLQSSFLSIPQYSWPEAEQSAATRPAKNPFEIVFELSKLRVHFNKESRHRRLLIAEMDRTSVLYITKEAGGSTTTATMGNLTFVDAESAQNKTLYREILGLKTDSETSVERQSSLLTMELNRNPRSRRYSTGPAPCEDESMWEGGVSVDISNKSVKGYDNFLKARFSPMRFVYLQQLWSEIMDYFFEGIVGYEVWGNLRPASAQPDDPDTDAPNADKVTFTRFDIILDSPIILFPVSYCSTDFIRLEAASIALANHYHCSEMRLLEYGSNNPPRLSWFNNCDILLEDLSILSWSGRILSEEEKSLSASVSLNWPTGPSALLNVPKWKVQCSFDELFLSLRQEDYALLQHIVQHNLGEESRHLDEWHALQNLPPLVLERYKQDIMVHFGYDKKDVLPTTFDVTMMLPVMCFELLREASMTAKVRCENVSWNYKKMLDLVSRQTVACDVEILDSSSTFAPSLLSSLRLESADQQDISDLTYCSTTYPSGENIKTLDINDSRIHLLYPAWKRFFAFFQGLPGPTFLSPDECIQVGERWYKIGARIPVPTSSREPSHPRLSWISNAGSNLPAKGTTRAHEKSKALSLTYKFLLTLKRPSILIGSDQCSVLLLADEVLYNHVGCSPLVDRGFKFTGVTVQTRRRGRNVPNDYSLMEPWSVNGEIHRCNGLVGCKCKSHSFEMSADVLSAKVTYSDLTTAVEVGLQLLRDVRESNRSNATSSSLSNDSLADDQSLSEPPWRPQLVKSDVEWDGFQLLVIDDSGRQFQGSQELVILTLGKIDFCRSEESTEMALDSSWGPHSDPPTLLYSMRLRLTGLDLEDCLQSSTSPFRTVATFRAAYLALPDELCPSSEDQKPQFAVELSSYVSNTRKYGVRIRSVDAQYNPTLIIALQRFLGRFSKDTKLRLDSTFDGQAREADSSPSVEMPRNKNLPKDVSVSLDIEHLRVGLNKEHQGRQLLEAALADCRVTLNQSRLGLVVTSHLGIFDVWKTDHLDGFGLNILKAGGESDNFVDVQYVTFSERKRRPSPASPSELPEWVSTKLQSQNDEIDDCLDVSVASLEVVYIKEVALELLDYLSSGMPGRGMGATSRAAQGFVNKRIQTKSFLQLQVEAPRILIPRNELTESGIDCHLGDLNIRSWVQAEESNSGSTMRMVNMVVSGLSARTYHSENESDKAPIFSHITVDVFVEKSRTELKLRTKVSAVDIIVRYTDFLTLLGVLQENVGKRIEKRNWDNLEVAWEEEALRDSTSNEVISPRYAKDVSYSESARFIRYGQPKASAGTTATKPLELFLSLDCNRMSLMLHRDDDLVTKNGSDSGYGIILLAIHQLSASLKRQDGVDSLSSSLGEVFLFDIGEGGRATHRPRSHSESSSLASSHSVMVEGYSDPNKSDQFDSQVVVTIDRAASMPDELNVSILVNYLSVAALLRPLEEVLSFLRCTWAVTRVEASPTTESVSLNDQPGLSHLEDSAGNAPQKPSGSSLKLKFVLHYTRFIFAADESDRNSRALVLEGLAMLNATQSKGSKGSPLPLDDPSVLQVHADFQNICSYINPDIATVVSLDQKHIDILTRTVPDIRLAQPYEGQDSERVLNQLSHGIPLLLPLTIGVEFEQKVYTSSPTKRSLGINVDSLSMMLSTEDAQLIDSVVKKWSRKTNNQTQARKYLFDVVFETQRLGIGLRKDGNKIVVDHVGVAARQQSIESGDALHAISGVVISSAAPTTLSDMVNRLAKEPRPLTVTFSRRLSDPNQVDQVDDLQTRVSGSHDENEGGLYQGSHDSLDVLVASAVVTVMEKEVTLLRGNASSMEVSCKLTRTSNTVYRIDLCSKIEIDYYNLRVWGWEPLLEPGGIFLSAEYQDPSKGPKEVSVELGDRSSGPLCVNLSDAAVETFSKFWQWRQPSEKDFEGALFAELGEGDAMNGLVSKKAANAALTFAQRQKKDSAKPCVFRNRSGVSIAFAQQKNRNSDGLVRSSSFLFMTVGEYHGLQRFRSSDVSVVANGEEAKFRVDVLPDSHDSKRGRRFPPLTVSLQAVADVQVEPLTNLEITRPGEMTYPLSFVQTDDASVEGTSSPREWASWLVEQMDERTVLTLGSSIRVISLLQESLEVGVEVVEGQESACGRIKSIGTCHSGIPFYLPLWLAMQGRKWRCYVRIASGYSFSHIFTAEEDGTVSTEQFYKSFVECQADRNPYLYLALGLEEAKGILSVTLDCAITLRNLLPTRLQWELADGTTSRAAVIDSSSLRRAGLNSSGAVLESGERAEVFSDGYGSLHLRVSVPEEPVWSTWVSLSLSRSNLSSTISSSNQDTVQSSVLYCRAKIFDEFGIPLPIGVRIASKGTGIEVAVYAEMWFSNCTSLPIAFGCPEEHIHPLGRHEVDSDATELSAAEAALKEISSLFETGDDGKGISRERVKLKAASSADTIRIPGQTGLSIVEECFEYIEVEYSTVKSRWWASENPRLPRYDMTAIVYDRTTWQWLDKNWLVDRTGRTADGWESTADLEEFSAHRNCNANHKYRRKRWFRARSGASVAGRLPSIDCFFQPIFQTPPKHETEKSEEEYLRVAMKVGGGKWALSLIIPRFGTVYGALRVAKERWPRVSASGAQQEDSATCNTVYELCYTVSPLDGDWGEVSRVMLVTPRFLLRNGSRKLVFEVKQSGSDDSTAVKIGPGETAPFHWASFRLPDLICVRPAVNYQRSPVYRWSGGFDPLTIGTTPLRVRKKEELPDFSAETTTAHWRISSIQAEADIRPRTGGTGINLSFQEEDDLGSGALFRIENHSCFPVWISQDGLLANLQLDARSSVDTSDDCVRPSECSVFALDVPFRQGKYAHRRAATMDELLRVRLALAPLSSRAGIETTKVISLTSAGERVRLNPSKLMLLDNKSRIALRSVRILGLVVNDGPTRVLRFCDMAKSESETLFVSPFSDEISSPVPDESRSLAEVVGEIEDAANVVSGIMSEVGLPTENEAVERAMFDVSQSYDLDSTKSHTSSDGGIQMERDLIISLRAAFQGFVLSLIDSAPSEICVISLKNVNALATWNMLRTTASTAYFTVTRVQVDNMLPNSPYPVAVYPMSLGPRKTPSTADENSGIQDESNPPILVIGLSFAPRHKSGTVCLRSVTVAPRDLAISIDLAFLVRLQTYILDLYSHFEEQRGTEVILKWDAPDIDRLAKDLDADAASGMGRQKFYFGGLTILPCNIKLSVAPARALTPAQASLEGEVATAIHQAVRKGDVRLGDTSALLGVKLGHRNSTPLAVVRGVFKSFVVDAFLRLNGAQLNFAGVSLRNHISTSSQLATHLSAHYFTSLRHNLPSVVGSLAFFGNPVGLVRGLGDGVSDFVLEPVRGFQRSVQELDASYLVDGVARGTLSLARHTVGGFADSAALLAETFSKNMTVLTLDRRYAQKRDRKDALRGQEGINVAVGIGSGVQKLAQGFIEGVTGVVKAPLRGAEKRGFEGFAKGIGKGLLGLLVKPIIGISDGITDVMIGVKGSVEGSSGSQSSALVQHVRPRRALYGTDRMLRPYNVADAAASALMLRTRLAGENYLSHYDMGNRVALLSAKRLILLGSQGEELLALKFKHIESLSVREIEQEDGEGKGWGIIVVLNTPRRNGSEVEVINCADKAQGDELCQLLEQGMKLVTREREKGGAALSAASTS